MENNILYILINNQKNVLGTFSGSNGLINFIGKYIENTLKILHEYNGNTEKFKNDILEWRISYYKDSELCYLYFNDKYTLKSSNSRISNVNYTINFDNDINDTNFNKNNDEMINKIFLTESENINCNVKIPIKQSDMNLIANIGTETLIQNNTETLKERLKQLELCKQKEITRISESKQSKQQKEIEKEMKINKEREDEFLRKFLVDRKLYFVFKKEIADDQRKSDNIPKLYLKQWHIFSEMEKNNNLDTNITSINDQNTNQYTNIIQKELCIYRDLDNKHKNTSFDSKYDGLFKSGDARQFSKIVESESSDDESSEEDDDENDNNTSDESSDDDEYVIGPLLKALKNPNK
jgi:hypothetical protein